MKQYIDKAAVVAWIKRDGNEYPCDNDEQDIGYHCALYEIQDFLDTLETKEVDLDFQRFAEEMDNIFALPSSETKNTEEEPLNWEYAIAKHFFELGLKAQKIE